MAYNSQHSSNTSKGKCVICDKITHTFLVIQNSDKTGEIQVGASIRMPVCDGEHYNLAVKAVKSSQK